MRKIAFYAVVIGGWLLFGIGAGYAADVAIQKALKAPAYPIDNSGWYVGVHTSADVAQTQVTGTNLFATSLVSGRLTAAGGEVGLAFGYIRGSVATDQWYGFASTVSYQNITASAPVAGASAGVASRWSATQTVEISNTWLTQAMAVLPGLGLQGVTTAFAGFTPIAPPGVNVAAPHQFFGFGAREFGITGTFGSASGTSWGAAPLVQYGSIWQILNPAGKPTGQAAKAYAWMAFPMRGITFNNIGGPGSPTVGAGASMGTQYGIALDLLF